MRISSASLSPGSYPRDTSQSGLCLGQRQEPTRDNALLTKLYILSRQSSAPRTTSITSHMSGGLGPGIQINIEDFLDTWRLQIIFTLEKGFRIPMSGPPC